METFGERADIFTNEQSSVRVISAAGTGDVQLPEMRPEQPHRKVMITVGDQIFTLNQEVRKLKKQCERYETTLREIAANGQSKSNGNPASLAQRVLTETLPTNTAS
jgi:hypothetical protein